MDSESTKNIDVAKYPLYDAANLTELRARLPLNTKPPNGWVDFCFEQSVPPSRGQAFYTAKEELSVKVRMRNRLDPSQQDYASVAAVGDRTREASQETISLGEI